MVSIIDKQKLQRDKKIAYIEKYLRENPESEIKLLILEICSSMHCSDRKAKEYYKIAKWRIEKDVSNDICSKDA